MIDYEILRIIWWALLGVLLIAFALTDGFDMGVAILLPWVGRSDVERRIVINTVAPFWEGNQVWLILGLGAIFAAWPYVYAVTFSGLYILMFIILSSLIFRPVAFKYRSKSNNLTWRSIWDWLLFLGGFIPSMLFGMILGNVLQGLPFHFDQNLMLSYDGIFWELINPISIIAGLVSVSMITIHGCCYLGLKTEEVIKTRCNIFIKFLVPICIIAFIGAGYLLYFKASGYTIIDSLNYAGASNPTLKQVSKDLIFNNQHLQEIYFKGWSLLTALLAIATHFLILFCSKHPIIAFQFSTVAIIMITSTFGLSLYPFILPSSLHPNHSLTVFDASSSQLTLFVMLIGVIIFLPLILAYTSWLYRVMRGKIKEEDVISNDKTFY